jgi:hypothetical protein
VDGEYKWVTIGVDVHHPANPALAAQLRVQFGRAKSLARMSSAKLDAAKVRLAKARAELSSAQKALLASTSPEIEILKKSLRGLKVLKWGGAAMASLTGIDLAIRGSIIVFGKENPEAFPEGVMVNKLLNKAIAPHSDEGQLYENDGSTSPTSTGSLN